MRKKLACLSLSLCMALVPVGGFVHGADQENSAGLLQAIETVKRTVDIPKEYSQFDYSVVQQKTNGGKLQVWSLSWTDPKNGGGIYAQADPFAQLSQTAGQQGILLSYSRYDKKEDQGPIGTVKRAAAEKTADEFLKKALPSSIAGQMKLAEKEIGSQSKGSHRFHYMLYEKGIPVKPLSVRIEVDPYSGQVTSYQGPAPGTRIPAFADGKAVISKEEAVRSYLNQIGMKLQYHSAGNFPLDPTNYSPGTNGEKRVFLAYSTGGLENGDQLAINGQSGQVWRVNSGAMPGVFETQNAAMDSESGGSGGSLTPEELKGYQEAEGLLTREQAAAALKQQAPQLFGGGSYQSASLGKNRNGGSAYQWDFSFESGTGSVDAESGRILSLYYGGDPKAPSDTKGSISEAQALNKAKEFEEKLAPDVFSSCKQAERIAVENDPKPLSAPSYSFQFYRQEQGIDFVDNGIFITVDGTGQLRFYQRIWDDHVIFPPITGALSQEQMFSKIQENNPFELAFEWGNPDHTTMMPVYEFTDPTAGLLWSPADGQRLNRDGTRSKDAALPTYSDIEGKWCEFAVRELLDNGYYIEGDRFQPNRVITQSEFLRYLYSPDYSSLSEKAFYRLLENQGILKEGEAAPDQALTRQDAAKFLIRHMGLEQAAVHGELYKNFFSDQVEQSYQGYATLCYGLGIMGGEKGGAFAGDQSMTRAEAASAIYRMLLVK